MSVVATKSTEMRSDAIEQSRDFAIRFSAWVWVWGTASHASNPTKNQ